MKLNRMQIPASLNDSAMHINANEIYKHRLCEWAIPIIHGDYWVKDLHDAIIYNGQGVNL